MGMRRTRYLTALGASVLFLFTYQQWLSWLILLIVLLFPWASLLLSLPGMLVLRVVPKAPAFVMQGTEAEARLVGWCRFPVPPFKGKLRITRLTTGEVWKQTADVPLPTDHCGTLLVEPVGIWISEYLGILGFPGRKGERTAVTVRPYALPIEHLTELDRSLASSWRPKFGGGYAENHELRLYRPGDSLNQVHWKLSAKTGKLILREPMQPERGLVLLTMELRGDGEMLDRKFGRLLWLGSLLLEKEVVFQLRCLTGEGVMTWEVDHPRTLETAIEQLLSSTPAAQGDVGDRDLRVSWRYHIGGEPDEV